MNRHRRLVFVLASFLVACANLKVETRHEPGFDFARFQSFAFAPNIPQATQAPGDRIDRELVNPIVRTAIVDALTKRGYRKVDDRARADFLVFFQTGTWSKERYLRQKGIDGHLLVRFIDRRSNETVWESHAQETVFASMDTDQEIRKALAAADGAEIAGAVPHHDRAAVAEDRCR